MKRTPTIILTVAAFSLFTLAACGSDTTPAAESPSSSATSRSDIVVTAEGAGQFKTLLAAVRAADLEPTLKSAGPFTVFAPTDEAFAKLPAGTVDTLLLPENKEKLKAILTYHVVSGKVPSTEAAKLSSAKTVNGKELTISRQGDMLKVDAATVVKADIEASNGIIHVIDAVVLPE